MAKSINLKAKFSADTTDIKKGAKESQAAVKDFTSQAGGAVDQFAGLFGTSMGQIGGALSGFQGGLVTLQRSFQASSTASGGFSKALGILKVALIATGIGAIVVALGALVAYFTKTQQGADQLAKFLAPLKVLFGALVDGIAKFGGVIIKAFSDPKQAIKDLWEALKTNIVNRVKGLIDMFGAFGRVIKAAFDFDWQGVKDGAKEAGSAFVQTMTGLDEQQRKKIAKTVKDQAAAIRDKMRKAEEFAAREQALAKLKIAFITEEADIQRRVAEEREKAADTENFNAKERLAANTEAMRLMELLGSKRVKIAKEERDILVGKNSLLENMNKDYEEEAQLSANILRIQADISNEKRSMLKRQKALTEEAEKLLLAEARIAELRSRAVPEIANKAKTPTLIPLKAPAIDVKEALAKYGGALKEVKNEAIDLSNFLADAMGGIIDTFATGFGELLAGEGDLKGFAIMVGNTFADMAIQVGKMAIGVGIATLGIKAALESLNPYVAIAAGIALVALGTAAKAGLKKVASGGGSAGTFSSNSYSNSSIDTRGGSSGNTDFSKQQIEVVVTGTLQAKGGALTAALASENNRKKLTT